MTQEKFPIYYVGSDKIVEFLQDVRIEGTLLIPQPFVMSFLPEFLNISRRPFFEPLLTIMIINEQLKDTIVKNGFKMSLENTICIYFPYEARVDQTLYKKANNAYESLLKEVPRSQRDLFAKLVIWEQGKGQHSPASHALKISSIISKELKNSVEKRIAALNEESVKIQPEALTIGKIARLHIVKLRLLKVYQTLKMHGLATPILMDQYQYICLNKFYFKNPTMRDSRPLSYNPTQIHTELVIDLLRSSDITLIEFMTHCYLEIFTYHCRCLKLVEALTFLQQFLSFIQNDVFEKGENTVERVLQNVWLIQLVETSLIIIQNYKNLLTLNRRAETDILHSSMKLRVKSAIEEIGLLLYSIPKNLYRCTNENDQLMSLFEMFEKGAAAKTYNVVIKEQLTAELSPKIAQIKNQHLRNTLTNPIDYMNNYIRFLEEIVTVFKDTKLKRIAFHIAMMVLKADPESLTIRPMDIISLEDIAPWSSLDLAFHILYAKHCQKKGMKKEVQKILSHIVKNRLVAAQNRLKILELINNQEPILQLQNCSVAQLTQVKISQVSKGRFSIRIAVKLLLSLPSNSIMSIQVRTDKLTEDIVFTNEILKNPSFGLIVAEKEHSSNHEMAISVQKIFCRIGHTLLSIHVPEDLRSQLHTVNTITVSHRWTNGTNDTVFQHLFNSLTLEFGFVKGCKKIQIKGDLEIKDKVVEYDSLVESDMITLPTYVLGKHAEGKVQSSLQIIFAMADYVSTVRYQIGFICKKALRICHQQGQTMSHLSLLNISQRILRVKNKTDDYVLMPDEQLCTTATTIDIGQEKDIMSFLDLNHECGVTETQQLQRFGLALASKSLKLFEKVPIQSEEIGIVRISAHEGYEMVGKIKGHLEYADPEKRVLALWLIPTKRGKIVLPDIHINDKKGRWNQPMIIDIQ